MMRTAIMIPRVTLVSLVLIFAAPTHGGSAATSPWTRSRIPLVRRGGGRPSDLPSSSSSWNKGRLVPSQRPPRHDNQSYSSSRRTSTTFSQRRHTNEPSSSSSSSSQEATYTMDDTKEAMDSFLTRQSRNTFICECIVHARLFQTKALLNCN
mmetsp:Transcript_16411/g.37855  ORF Transcript_16411/g.37855 Transcript_16411/m.37855 type:complete len:152 (+) Transcript_16411:730-1185(+)